MGDTFTIVDGPALANVLLSFYVMIGLILIVLLTLMLRVGRLEKKIRWWGL